MQTPERLEASHVRQREEIMRRMSAPNHPPIEQVLREVAEETRGDWKDALHEVDPDLFTEQ